MANLTIRGYERLSKDADGNTVLAGDESTLRWRKTVAFGPAVGSAVVPSKENVRFVRIASDSAQNTWFNIGSDDAAAATDGSDLLQGAEYFGVYDGAKISAVEGT